MTRRWNRTKRLLDIAGSLLGLVLAGPVMLVLALLVRLSLGSPVLYHQPRSGRHGRSFRIIKFRTMRDMHDNQGRLLSDAERLTRLGLFLRRTSLDELPEFMNVLRGDMSLVGPRPLLSAYLDRYTPEQARRHEVRPGITGWAQINGRNTLLWEEKFALDVWYVDHRTLRLDLKILWLTLIRVLRREGINADGHATMPEFTGTKVRRAT
jgi:lipopolysaccharide/colanic/teichoic acid biosynthesis glycosyltransferase